MTAAIAPEARRQLALVTDTRLAALYEAKARNAARLAALENRIRFLAAQPRVKGEWVGYFAEAEAAIRELCDHEELTWTPGHKALTDLDAARAEQREVHREIGILDMLHSVHRWNRYFLVTSSDGHVHRGMNCATCFATTEYGWLPELADCDEDAMIAEFGEKACTVCFPDAPANPAFHAPGSRDREAIEARAAEKAQREAAKFAKRLREDEQFRDHQNDRVETVARCKEILRNEVELRDYYGQGEHPWHEASITAAGQAKIVLLAREAAAPGTGASQEEIDKIIANAVKGNRKNGARI
jgi:hypothetical protein